LLSPLPSLLPLSLPLLARYPCHHCHCPLCTHLSPLACHPCCQCHCCAALILFLTCHPQIDVAIALAALTLALFIAHQLIAIAIAIANIIPIAFNAIAGLPPLLPLPFLLMPLPSLLHVTLIANAVALETLVLFVARHPQLSLPLQSSPSLLLPSSSEACSCCSSLPAVKWSCGHQCSLACHHPTLMLPLLVDWLFSSPVGKGDLGPSFASPI
jgi:hypothetical protein